VRAGSGRFRAGGRHGAEVVGSSSYGEFGIPYLCVAAAKRDSMLVGYAQREALNDIFRSWNCG